MSLTYEIEQHRKTEDEIKKLNKKLSRLYAQLKKHEENWQKECTHPAEYQEVFNKTGTDDYGSYASYPKCDWKVKCVACGLVYPYKAGE